MSTFTRAFLSSILSSIPLVVAVLLLFDGWQVVTAAGLIGASQILTEITDQLLGRRWPGES